MPMSAQRLPRWPFGRELPAHAARGGAPWPVPAVAPVDGGSGDAAAHDEHRVRTVFISDVHLGTPGCQAGALLEFLRAYPSERLYLVGDIIDGWQLRRRWYWPQSHNDVVQKLLRRARKGCEVIYVPGNHDEFARRFVEQHFGGVWVVDEALHRCADGRLLWVTHGDLYDGVVQCARWLALAGDAAYTAALALNRQLNRWRARWGLPYWSISQVLKLKVKRAVSFIDDFERVLAAEAARRGADGVVCGHIHHAEMRLIGKTLYCNDGDWVESRTALVEHFDGRLEIVRWHDSNGDSRGAAPATGVPAAPAVPAPAGVGAPA